MADKGVIIKFDPVRIAEVATNLENQHKRFLKSLASAKKKAEGLNGLWQGESADLYLEKMRMMEEQGEEMAKIMLAFSVDLAQTSGIYKTGETNAKLKAESLPTDGVFLV